MNEVLPSAFTCLVIDHDDTSVARTPSIHYPAYVEALRRLRPGHAPLSLAGWFRKSFNPGLLGYLVGELGYAPEEVAINNAIWRSFTASRVAPFFPGFLALLAKFRQSGGLVVVVSHSETDKIIRDYLADLGVCFKIRTCRAGSAGRADQGRRGGGSGYYL